VNEVLPRVTTMQTVTIVQAATCAAVNVDSLATDTTARVPYDVSVCLYGCMQAVRLWDDSYTSIHTNGTIHIGE